MNYRIKILGTKRGFTLAEVLITLTIIGVVAALSIPALIQNVQDQQLKAAWKKTYSDFNQAYTKYLLDNGGSFKGLCPNTQYPNSDNCIRGVFLQYMSYVKKCDDNNTLGICFHTNTDTKNLDGSSRAWSNCAGGILSNGVIFDICLNASDCSANSGNQMEPYCGNIAVDINGFSGPNVVGKDIYSIWVLENSIKPAGYVNDKVSTHTTCDSNSLGTGCSALYLKQ